MFQNNRCMDMNDMSKFEMKKEMKMDAGMPMHSECCPQPMGCCPQPMTGMVCPPIYECPQERCVHREILHEVPHIQPCNTRIINHHIYRHTFQPTFSCCEENVCSEVYENPCCGRF